jgi:23S rRNA (adenine2503-C2)-methyltransferase
VTQALQELIGMNREDMAAFLQGIGAESFRLGQLWHWVYQKGVCSFDEMTTMAKPMRESLRQSLTLKRPFIVKDMTSFDGTRKWLLRFSDAQEAEMVFIPEKDRGTLCVSSQVGCTLTCSFCHTGTQKLVRNLTAGEILGQLVARLHLQQELP